MPTRSAPCAELFNSRAIKSDMCVNHSAKLTFNVFWAGVDADDVIMRAQRCMKQRNAARRECIIYVLGVGVILFTLAWAYSRIGLVLPEAMSLPSVTAGMLLAVVPSFLEAFRLDVELALLRVELSISKLRARTLTDLSSTASSVQQTA